MTRIFFGSLSFDSFSFSSSEISQSVMAPEFQIFHHLSLLTMDGLDPLQDFRTLASPLSYALKGIKSRALTWIQWLLVLYAQIL
jgi:hypothetical protein